MSECGFMDLQRGMTIGRSCTRPAVVIVRDVRGGEIAYSDTAACDGHAAEAVAGGWVRINETELTTYRCEECRATFIVEERDEPGWRRLTGWQWTCKAHPAARVKIASRSGEQPPPSPPGHPAG